LGQKKIYSIVLAVILFGQIVGYFPSAIAQESSVPEWVKNNAMWWAEGSIKTSDYVNGLEFLIKEQVIRVPSVLPPAAGQVSDLNEIKMAIDEIKKDVKTIINSQPTDFEFELDSTSTVSGAVSFTMFGKCTLPANEGPCGFFEVKKIVAPPLSNVIFLFLCVDYFTCDILQDQGYKIGFSAEGGFSLAAHGAGGAGADVNGPIIPILPTNILKVSGHGPTSAKSVVTIADISVNPTQAGLKGKMTFVGERPSDMEMFGWYFADGKFTCFNEDGVKLNQDTCNNMAIPSIGKQCVNVNLLPTINLDKIKSLLSRSQIGDIELPLETLDFEICTDGTFKAPPLKGFNLFRNPVGSAASSVGDFCKVTETGLVCNKLILDTAGTNPPNLVNIIKSMETTVGQVHKIVSFVEKKVISILNVLGLPSDGGSGGDSNKGLGSSCTSNSQCSSGNCGGVPPLSSGLCAPKIPTGGGDSKKGLGSSCTSNSQCSSGNCGGVPPLSSGLCSPV